MMPVYFSIGQASSFLHLLSKRLLLPLQDISTGNLPICWVLNDSAEDKS